MIRVGLARTEPGYAGLSPPFAPGKPYPEVARLLGGSALGSSANPIYDAVRRALLGLGLDHENYGSDNWNPLGDLVERGRRIVLKPNFIRHWNPNQQGSIESVITHGSILRAVADYAFIAAGPGGSVAIAEAPQHDCDLERIRAIVGLDELVALYEDALGRTLEVIDLRRERVVYRDGVIVERHPLPGDPAGYRAVDLGERSFFTGSGLDPKRFRGADYDPGPTTENHTGGRHAYLLSETVLSADLVVNLPKLKTHKKTGVTLALKNLVGINGDKNWLPHHCVGSPTNGGDEYPGMAWADRIRSGATEIARALLSRGVGSRLVRWVRRAEDATRGADFIRSGNWHGNRTTWRMCLDLNRCLYYSDANGLHLDAPAPVRTVLTIVDGIVAGEGEGPLAPLDRPLGAVIAGVDPVAVDLAAVRLMGFDERRLPKVCEAMRDAGPRITAVRSPAEVIVGFSQEAEALPSDRSLAEIECDAVFRPHAGWVGHVERSA